LGAGDRRRQAYFGVKEDEMKFGILAVFFLLASSRADALEIQVQPHERSTTVSTARFELIQSQLTAKLTFRIDKVTGKTFSRVVFYRGPV
jgi:hypothetical protein